MLNSSLTPSHRYVIISENVTTPTARTWANFLIGRPKTRQPSSYSTENEQSPSFPQICEVLLPKRFNRKLGGGGGRGGRKASRSYSKSWKQNLYLWRNGASLLSYQGICRSLSGCFFVPSPHREGAQCHRTVTCPRSLEALHCVWPACTKTHWLRQAV